MFSHSRDFVVADRGESASWAAQHRVAERSNKRMSECAGEEELRKIQQQRLVVCTNWVHCQVDIN
jgi:hypothetical protein